MNGMRIVVLVAALGGLMSAAVDPDELLKALRRISYRSALTASLATRLVPVLARDAAPDERRRVAAGRSRPAGSRSSRAALAGALDRAVDVAAALEVRGYALARPAARAARKPLSRHDLRDRRRGAGDRRAGDRGRCAAGAGHVEAYPTLDVRPARPSSALACALVAARRRRRCVGRSARLGVARA